MKPAEDQERNLTVDLGLLGLLILIAAATFMCLEIGWLARNLRLQLIPQAQAVVKKADTTLDSSNTALLVEQAHWDAELRETRKATADIHDLIIHTDVSLNGRHGDSGILGDLHANVVPRVVAILQDSDTAAVHVAAAVDRTGAATDVAVGKVGPLLDALTARVSDPSYDRILADAAESMHNLAGMTADGKQMTADSAAFVHRELAPVKGAWNSIKAFLFEIAGPAASVATALR